MSPTGNGVITLLVAAMHECVLSLPIKKKEEVRRSHVYSHGVLQNTRIQRDFFLKKRTGWIQHIVFFLKNLRYKLYIENSTTL